MKTRRVNPEFDDEDLQAEERTETQKREDPKRRRFDIQTRVVDLDTGLILYSQTSLFFAGADCGGLPDIRKAITNMVNAALMYIAARINGGSLPVDLSPKDHDQARAAQLAGLLTVNRVDVDPTFVLPTDNPNEFVMVTKMRKK